MGKWVSWLILKIEMGHLRGWGHMGDGSHGQQDTWAIRHGQLGIMVNNKYRDGVPWVIEHMANGAHGQLGT